MECRGWWCGCGWENVKRLGMRVRKGTVISFVPTLFGCFLGIPSLHIFSSFKMLFCDLFVLFFGGRWGYRAIDHPIRMYDYSNSGDRLR